MHHKIDCKVNNWKNWEKNLSSINNYLHNKSNCYLIWISLIVCSLIVLCSLLHLPFFYDQKLYCNLENGKIIIKFKWKIVEFVQTSNFRWTISVSHWAWWSLSSTHHWWWWWFNSFTTQIFNTAWNRWFDHWNAMLLTRMSWQRIQIPSSWLFPHLKKQK